MLCMRHIRNTGLLVSWGDNPGEGGQPGCNPPSPSGFSPPVPRFPPSPSPYGGRCEVTPSHDAAQNAVGQNLAHEIVGTVQHVRFPQERGGLWKRERERKPLGGERISIVRCALSPPKEVVARTPVDGSCVTHTVHEIEQHTSPQDSGKSLLRRNSTQMIRDRKK